jgi:cation-transporting ATPase I
VAAVPEGLPLVATVAQTGAARRLSTRGVLVRSARTVEALGRVDTVCFDKTGTLTEGRLRLVRLAGPAEQWSPEAPEAARVLRAAARACSRPDDGQPAAHATDQAILDGADAVLGDGVDEDWEELTEVPFQSDRGYSAALGRTSGSLRLVVKGAPEVLLPRCTHQRDDTGRRRFERRDRERATRMVHELAAEGLRVLAVARRTVGTGVPPEGPDPEELTEDLTLLGFVALADVPRPQAAGTVAALREAGLTPVMITGDHPVTARAIARSLGIPADRVVTGPEFAALDEAGRADVATRSCVYARVSPEQKLRIVAALQRAGRVVAMTGDGANDAAAIRLADVGIGMAAHGSTSARTAADLVLTRPDPSLLLDALVEGRAMWGRVRDAVAILLGGNAGEVGFTLAGTALAGRAPLGTRQFLLVNMLTDLLPSMAIALAPTPQAADARRRLLAGGAPSLGAPLLRDIAVRGAATGVGALAAWQIGRVTGLRRRASTMALVALVGTQLGQTLVVGGRDPLVVATALGSAAALAGIVQTPGASQFFGCTPLDPLAWGVVLGAAAGTTALSVLAGRLLPAPAPPDPDRTEEAR